MVRGFIILLCLVAICMIVGKVCYECGRYHRSAEAMLDTAIVRLYEPVWKPAEPRTFGKRSSLKGTP